jgi:hypothetical protein
MAEDSATRSSETLRVESSELSEAMRGLNSQLSTLNSERSVFP